MNRMRVNVSITNISAERFWDPSKPMPPPQISTNLSLVDVERKKQDLLEVPFLFTVGYNPSIAQMSLKGKAYVAGSEAEINRIQKEHRERKPPPPAIIQTISSVVFAEAILVSRTLNLPPPIPLPKIDLKKPSGSRDSRQDYSA